MTNYFFLGRAGLTLAFICLGLSHGFAQSIITTYAGGDARAVVVSGMPALTQHIGAPRGVASDNSGGFYFSNSGGVYRVASDGTLRVIAGDGVSGFSGDGGPATSARLSSPGEIALDGMGNLFIADCGNGRIRKVTSDGIIHTVAGGGTQDFVEGGLATSARFSPAGIAVDGTGNLFIADPTGLRILKVTPDGIIRTVAGSGDDIYNRDGILATAAGLGYPSDVAVDKSGNFFIADYWNSGIRKVTSNGIITTVAQLDGYPTYIAVDNAGNLFFAKEATPGRDSNRIWKVTSGKATIVAGNGTRGFSGDGGPANAASLLVAAGVTADPEGNIFIVDFGNFRIRKVGLDGIIRTVAGSGLSNVGDGGLATAARLSFPMGVAVDGAGNLLISDTYNRRVRRVGVDGKIETVTGNGEYGYSGDGGPASSATLSHPTGVAADSSGNLFIVDTCNQTIRKVNSEGVMATVGSAGTWNFCASYGDVSPANLALDHERTLFVPDTRNFRIVKVTSSGITSRVAGGSHGSGGDGGPAIFAQLNFPTGVAVDHEGNLFIADRGGHRIRKVTVSGIISTVAGTGAAGFSGDGGSAAAASLSSPAAVAYHNGNLFIADSGNARIRKVAPDGIITTVAGNGMFGFSGDGGIATAASFGTINGIAVDADGSLFVADSGNNRIRKVTFVLPAPTLTSVSPDLTSPGATTEITLKGTSFGSPFTINPSSGIAVEHIQVIDEMTATATLTIASNATLGPRGITVTTGSGTSNAATLTVAPPFPDLKVTSNVGRFAVGFNGVYTVDVRNVGTLPAPGPMTLTDTLPTGLTYVSGTGSGWSCSAAEQIVTCGNSEVLDAGASSTLTMTVAVGAAAAPAVTHTISVAAMGDLVASNNVASDATAVVNPSPVLQFTPTSPGAGQQATMGIALPETLPYDVTGTVTLSFASEATIPLDDPAIQFATGGRQVTFVIPANTFQARFGTNTQPGPLPFQMGTVAGSFAFEGMLQAGAIAIPFSSTLKIPRQAPAIQAVQTSTTDGFVASLTLWSTAREINQLVLRFDTAPAVRLSCGSIGKEMCAVSHSTLILNVKDRFDYWYATDTEFGSLTTLRLPLSITGNVAGNVHVTLRNSMGQSAPVTFPLP